MEFISDESFDAAVFGERQVDHFAGESNTIGFDKKMAQEITAMIAPQLFERSTDKVCRPETAGDKDLLVGNAQGGMDAGLVDVDLKRPLSDRMSAARSESANQQKEQPPTTGAPWETRSQAALRVPFSERARSGHGKQEKTVPIAANAIGTARFRAR